MKFKSIVLFLFVFCMACKKDQKEEVVNEKDELVFDAQKWQIKKGEDYVYRDKMLHDVVYNDTIRTLSKTQLITLLGNPDRIENNHFYYVIEQKRIDLFPLHVTTMVIKITPEDKIEWIKIHK